MKQLVVKRHRAFTLVEIMVTMAILVVMMGFLFQFVLGAQRIWSATAKDTEMFEQAQIIFNVMESDLKNMICEVPDENPDGGMQVYLDTEDAGDGDDGYRLVKMCFMTSYASEAEEKNDNSEIDNNLTKRTGVYPVCYQLVSIPGSDNPPFRLYRYNFDRIVKKNGTSGTELNPFFAYAADSSSFGDDLKDYQKGALLGDEKDELRELISEEIETLKVQVFPKKMDGNLLTKKPISVKLTVKLRQKEQNSQKTPEMRTFTKIVFVE
ncbi:MAG: prepilin-type N-terminal cleavage/methylation domain-containing protein [Victivallales bacterium]|nr:prepilin-type N-terminal cleavage/methylation domain-containing protein [Victivallales bacterium]